MHVRLPFVVTLGAILSSATTPVPVAAQAPSDPVLEIRVVGDIAASEGFERRWVAELVPRPVDSSPNGYEPGVPTDVARSRILPIDFERPVEFRWNFDYQSLSVSEVSVSEVSGTCSVSEVSGTCCGGTRSRTAPPQDGSTPT